MRPYSIKKQKIGILLHSLLAVQKPQVSVHHSITYYIEVSESLESVSGVDPKPVDFSAGELTRD